MDRFIAQLLTLVFIFATAVCAESSTIPDSIELPAGTAILPEPGNSAPIGVTIDPQNINGYKSIVPPELLPLIRSGALALDAAKRLRYVWRLGDAQEDQSRKKAGALPQLDADGNISATVAVEPGSLFGPGAELIKEWASIGADGDKAEAASQLLSRKVLHNISSQWWWRGLLDSAFRITWIKEGKPYRATQGEFTRIYPAAVNLQDKTEQLFRERIVFLSPSVISRYTWMTFRFRGSDEDMVWVYSPASKKTRQLTGSNRADSMATSGVSSDDLLGWSGNPRQVESRVERLETVLVPFPSADLTGLSAVADNCSSVSVDDPSATGSRRSQVQWNFEQGRFPGAAAWVPVSAIYAPRQAWRIELLSRDPYSLYGRQVLYVDAITQLPIYKFVYDRSGKAWKVILASFGLAASGDRTVKLPYPAFMVVIDMQNNIEYTVEYSKVRYCSSLPVDRSMTDFDPRRLADIPTNTPATLTDHAEQQDVPH